MKRTSLLLVSVSVLSALLISCNSDNQNQVQILDESEIQSVSIKKVSIDEKLGEKADPNEENAIKEIESEILTTLKKQYQTGLVKRDVHTKHHGCVKATFKVNSNLAPEYKVGIFAEGKEYKSWIRFSNGNGDANNPDTKGDVRGMAIKLMGVAGKKLLESQANEQTQDFVMMNNNRFFIKNLSDYVGFNKAVSKGGLGIAWFLATHPKTGYIVAGIFNKKVDSPLNTEFFSATPYKLGENAIKFKVQPCSSQPLNMPENPSKDYLREAMNKKLSSSDACFDFMVQTRKGSLDKMSIEDSTIAWDEKVSPYISVAKITIPKQTFDSKEQMDFCENLSFTPWHSLEEHKPLGSANRTRKAVYETISKYRHDQNGITRKEPNSWTF